MVGLHGFLMVSAVLFVAGLWAVMSRRNAVWVFMGIELILNAASLNFVAFSRYIAPPPNASPYMGMIASIFIILLAAAEAAVALAILLAVYRNYRSIQTQDFQELRG